MKEEIHQVGLVTTDDGAVACSPDGLFGFIPESTGDAPVDVRGGHITGIEIKCPTAPVHIGYLMANKVPAEYLAQVHGSMYVTSAPSWRFMSYCRKFPPLILTVERDEEIQRSLGFAINAFIQRLDIAFKHLCHLNGGPPQHLQKPNGKTRPEYVPDENDLIP